MAVTAVGVLPATAHTVRYASEVTIKHPEPGLWRGKVKSERQRCVRNRLVKLWFDGEKDFVLAEDTTDAEGRWRMKPAPGDTYYATVERVRRGGPGHKHVCKGDRSPTIE